MMLESEKPTAKLRNKVSNVFSLVWNDKTHTHTGVCGWRKRRRERGRLEEKGEREGEIEIDRREREERREEREERGERRERKRYTLGIHTSKRSSTYTSITQTESFPLLLAFVIRTKLWRWHSWCRRLTLYSIIFKLSQYPNYFLTIFLSF